MNAETRRLELKKTIEAANEPISATALAAKFSVSRQVIVGDIALLRAAGAAIEATPRGYIAKTETMGLMKTIACVHSGADMEKELNIIVDNGCVVIDVVVEHPVYGQLTGQLSLSSRYDVARFIEKSYQNDAQPLSALTGGVHLHNIRCPDAQAYTRVRDALFEAGLLFSQD